MTIDKVWQASILLVLVSCGGDSPAAVEAAAAHANAQSAREPTPIRDLLESTYQSLLRDELTYDEALDVSAELAGLVRQDGFHVSDKGEKRYVLAPCAGIKRAEACIGLPQEGGYRRHELQFDWDARLEPFPEATSEVHLRIAFGLHPEPDAAPEYCVVLAELVHPLDDKAWLVARDRPAGVVMGAVARFTRGETTWMPITHRVVGREGTQVNWEKRFEPEQPRALVPLATSLLEPIRSAFASL